MLSRKLHTVAVAFLLLLVSTYCAVECVVQPCHEMQAAADPSAPPCHRQTEQQPQDDSAERCLHPQFVVDTQQMVSVLPDLTDMHYADLLIVEPTLFAPTEGMLQAPAELVSPPPLHAPDLSTVLRV